jgi:RNA 3'-terminal phosphate cyclase-like protein
VAYSTRVSPQFANRMVESARSVLNRYSPDIYLYTDVYKGEESGKSPGYGLTLVTQSSTSATHAAERLSTGGGLTPEDIALQAARLLLEEVSRGGCVDGKHQWLVFLLMALGKEDVGKCVMGSLTPHS